MFPDYTLILILMDDHNVVVILPKKLYLERQNGYFYNRKRPTLHS